MRRLLTFFSKIFSKSLGKRVSEEEIWKFEVVSKLAETLLIPNNCEFVKVQKPKNLSVSQEG